MTKHSLNLDLIFQALSDPTRRAFLARMANGPISVSALAEPTGFALPTVMKHLDILVSADLITTEKNGRIRMCQARTETLAATEGWLATQRANWESQTDRLESYLATLQKGRTP